MHGYKDLKQRLLCSMIGLLKKHRIARSSGCRS